MRSFFLLSTLSLVACSTQEDLPWADTGELDPAVSALDAMNMATVTLDGYNAGNYDQFTTYWSDDLKAMLPESDFGATREQFMAEYGEWQDIDSLDFGAAETEGYVRYTFYCTFSKTPVVMQWVLPEDQALVTGSRFVTPDMVE